MEDKLLFTNQAVQVRDGPVRKKMKFLTGGDSGYNVWPVTQRSVASMPHVDEKIHGEIFVSELPLDSGEEDGGDAEPEETLSDKKYVPFPKEHEEKLTREVMTQFGIDVGVFLNPGAAQCLIACLLLNKRGVGIAKSAAHKAFMEEQLCEAVRIHRLACWTRPQKPQALLAWESRNNTTAGSSTSPPSTLAPQLPSVTQLLGGVQGTGRAPPIAAGGGPSVVTTGLAAFGAAAM